MKIKFEFSDKEKDIIEQTFNGIEVVSNKVDELFTRTKKKSTVIEETVDSSEEDVEPKETSEEFIEFKWGYSEIRKNSVEIGITEQCLESVKNITLSFSSKIGEVIRLIELLFFNNFANDIKEFKEEFTTRIEKYHVAYQKLEEENGYICGLFSENEFGTIQLVESRAKFDHTDKHHEKHKRLVKRLKNQVKDHECETFETKEEAEKFFEERIHENE